MASRADARLTAKQTIAALSRGVDPDSTIAFIDETEHVHRLPIRAGELDEALHGFVGWPLDPETVLPDPAAKAREQVNSLPHDFAEPRPFHVPQDAYRGDYVDLVAALAPAFSLPPNHISAAIRGDHLEVDGEEWRFEDGARLEVLRTTINGRVVKLGTVGRVRLRAPGGDQSLRSDEEAQAFIREDEARADLIERLDKIAANRGLPSEDRADLREAASTLQAFDAIEGDDELRAVRSVVGAAAEANRRAAEFLSKIGKRR